MKAGDIVELEGEKYIVQDEILACRYCHFDTIENMDCYNKFGCKSQDQVIFVKIPIELVEKIEQLKKQIEMMINCGNCGNEEKTTFKCFGECNMYDKWEMRK
jgi:hypothetical protein